jgi:hypothetical protein
MGWQNLLLKGKKVAGKVLKKANTSPKTDLPFYGSVGTVLGGRHIYHKVTGKKTDWDIIKESAKKIKKRKKDTSLHKGEK